VLAACLLLVNCAPGPGPSAIHPVATARSKSDPIDVYRTGSTVPPGSTTLGELTVRGDERGALCDHTTVVAVAKREARAAGADAIYLAREQRPNLLRACWWITARIIKYPTNGNPLATVQNAQDASARTANWGREIPAQTEILSVAAQDRNPSRAGSSFDRAADAVFRITGTHASGTGFFIASDGVGVTNHHVVAGQASLEAVLRDGTTLPLKVLRSDSLADVALVQADCSRQCNTLDLAAGLPEIGRDVHVIGNPMSYDFTLTRGIVSALRRGSTVTLLQTDAAINHGNSGGPILDGESREVLAIVTWKVQRERTEGLGFGVVIADALRVLGVHYAAEALSSR
jgi:S1-C subfamily serine protease